MPTGVRIASPAGKRILATQDRRYKSRFIQLSHLLSAKVTSPRTAHLGVEPATVASVSVCANCLQTSRLRPRSGSRGVWWK